MAVSIAELVVAGSPCGTGAQLQPGVPSAGSLWLE